MDRSVVIFQAGNPIDDIELSRRARLWLAPQAEASLASWSGLEILTMTGRVPAATSPAFSGAGKVPLTKGSKGKKRSRSRQRILIVDDVADVTDMIGFFLKHAGYEVATADSALSALRLARSQKFDMIISDIGMPQMNGYELAGALRTLPKYRQTPIIAVTGYSEYDDRGRAVRAGFSTHLTKPIDPSGLLNLINELLG